MHNSIALSLVGNRWLMRKALTELASHSLGLNLNLLVKKSHSVFVSSNASTAICHTITKLVLCIQLQE